MNINKSFAIATIPILLATITPFTSNATSIIQNLHFDSKDIELVDTVIDGVKYVRPHIEGFENHGDIGFPEIPTKYITFSVPTNSSDYQIRINVLRNEEIPIDGKAFPSQYKISTSKTDFNPPFAFLNEKGISHQDFFPQNVAIIKGISYIGGFNKTLNIGINPLRYMPNDDKFDFISDLSIELQWTNATQDDTAVIYPNNSNDIAEWVAETKKIVINSDDVDRNASLIVNKHMEKAIQIGNKYDYIIITAKELMESFERLAAIRRMKGHNARVFAIEDILNDARFKDGDIVSGIKDDAGKLRAFLTYAFQYYGTRHVLLGGNDSLIPVRFGYHSKYFKNEGVKDYPISSDLYYGELNQSWNTDNSDKYGNCGKMSDFDCELYVGRLCCTTKEEIDNYIDKLYIYEFNPGNGNLSYLNNCIAIVAGSMEYDYNSYCKPSYKKIYSIDNIKEVFQTDCDTPKGNEVINIINNGNFGFIDFNGHGSPEGVSSADQYFSKTCEDRYKNWGVNALDGERAWLQEESNNALDCIKNKYYPNWSHSMSCTLMPLKLSEYQDGTKHLTYNFVESYIMGKDYGGVAFWGNTENGWIGPSHELQGIFMTTLYETNKNQKSTEVGKIGALTKIQYGKKGSYKDLLMKHNIMGDPAIPLWCRAPYTIHELNLQTLNSQTIYIASHNITSKYTSKLEIKGNIVPADGFLNNTTYTVYGPDILPYIYPLNISGIEFNSNLTFCAKDINIGGNPGSISPNGNVIFSDGSDMRIYASGNVDISNNTVFRNGCDISIISEQNIKLSNIVINSGAKVTLCGENINIGSGVKIEKGAIVSFINKERQ